MSKSNLPVSNVFSRNMTALHDDNIKIIVNQGGTRSSKTYSILQLLVLYLSKTNHNEIFSIVRKSFPSLRNSVMRDFIEILTANNMYDETKHNKTENTYALNSNLFEFLSLDQPQKKRGSKRKYLFVNEANELSREDWYQLVLRTTGKIFIDFNPSDAYHWIYDEVMERDDVAFIQSTYQDNPFLEQTVKQEIERLQQADSTMWKVYGLGERANLSSAIFTHWQTTDNVPAGGEVIYGLDFGFNNPTALVKVVHKDKINYVQELLYQTNMTNADLIDVMKKLLPHRERTYIYGDSAEPDRITELRLAGFNLIPAQKEVSPGIDAVKAFPLFITRNSNHLLKEIKSYSWKPDPKNAEQYLDEPNKTNDHLMDALRYAVHSHLKNMKRTRITSIRRIG